MKKRARVTWRWNGRARGFHLAHWWHVKSANDGLSWGVALGGVKKTSPKGGRLAHENKRNQETGTTRGGS